MHPSVLVPAELPAGDPGRLAAGRAVRGSLLLAGLFVAFLWAAKELPALYARTPWQDDPYDALISATIFFVPVLAGLCLLRAPLCRRRDPLPVRRVLDLLRACKILVGAVLVTFAGEWVSVALEAHRGAWTAVTLMLIGVLVLLTVLGCLVAAQLRRAWLHLPDLPADSGEPAQPGWLADAAVLGDRLAARLGRRRKGAGRALGRLEREMLAHVRDHSAGSALAVSLAFGALVSASQLISEGFRVRAALLFLAVPACGMFAFLLAVGAYLHLAGPPGGSRLLRAVAAACASVPLTFAFRTAVLSAFGIPLHRALPVLSGLALAGAIAVGTVVLAVEPVIRRSVHTAQRRSAAR